MNARHSAAPTVGRSPTRTRAALRLLAPLALAFPCATLAQNLTVTPIGSGDVTPQSMAQSLLAGSSGINIVNVQYAGANGASGTFSGGNGVIGFNSGVLLTTGTVANVVGPNQFENAGFGNGAAGDASLDALVGGGTEDASVLTITFVPTGSTAQFSYVFASEEYPEYSNSNFNDVFAFFVNGTNYALVPGTQTPVAINNINCGLEGTDPNGPNCNRYINNINTAPIRNTEMDGLTTVLSFTAPVIPGQQNTLKLAIADRGDDAYDSAVFIAAGSFTSTQVPPAIQLGVAPSRITASQQVTISWNVQNSTTCTVSGGAAGSTFNVNQTATSGTATTNVTVGANPRVDTFFVQCTGPGGTTKGSTALAVGAAPPPPARPVALQSAGLNGAAANAKASAVSLSDGGKFVAFETPASNMVANDTNGSTDVFVRDTSNGTLRRVSLDTGGAQLASVSGEPRITRDGRFVAFTRGTGQTASLGNSQKAITGGQVCLYDLNGNMLSCVSKSPGGAAGNGDSGKPSISGDGKVTVFESKATNLGSTPDPNGSVTDVFSYNKDTNTNTILSNTSAGAPSTANSTGPNVSCNGKNFVFESLAPLAPGATQAGVKNIVAISLVGGGKKLVTIGTGGAASNGDSRSPKITDDGRFVYFESSANNLVAGDTNNVSDVFQADLATSTIKRMSVSATGAQANGASRNPSMTCDGSYVTFDSDATNLVAGDSNGTTDTFILNTASGTMVLESQTTSGGATNGPSSNGQVSPDGSVVGFDSNAGNLGATAGGSVYSGQNPLSVQNFTGVWYDPAQSGHGLFLESLPNGTLLAWWFTFDPSGAQAWFGGTGPQNGSTATVNVVRTQGARFLPNFNSTDAKNTPIGTLTFNFTSCDTGRVDFALDSTFATGFMNLKKLTGPVGTNCTPGQATTLDEGTKQLLASIDTAGPPTLYPLAGMPKALEPQLGPIAGITGVWYSPSQSGQGLFFENLGNGSVLAWWFTFGPSGGQAWFGGGGTITGANTAVFNFVKTQGGLWIPNFNPANVSSPSIGPVTLTVTDCGTAILNYNFGQGFGAGVFSVLQPLTRPIGTICSE